MRRDPKEIAAQMKARLNNINPKVTGGGLIASIEQSPIAWSVGSVIVIVIIATAIWAAIYSAQLHVTVTVDTNDDFVLADTDDNGWSDMSKPNIIFFLADDLGWNSIGYEDFDLPFVTPTLTNMAKSGIIMNSFYAQEVCTPARASLLTGRNPLSVGMQYSMVQTAIPWGLDLGETTIAQALSDDGYQTHAFGKWHLGHYSPRYLPTARGFDTFFGFLNGENYYWSKKNPDHTTFNDLMYSTRECYAPYTSEDMHDYSTFLYRDKALETIDAHNSSEGPMFMYMAFQAVHDPFVDIGFHESGIPSEYLDADIYDQIISSVKGRKRRQYAMSLNLMDEAVSDIVTRLDERGMLNNTVIIFASDNGGCYGAGGKNGPLRGTKGSMFEGGTKVDAFMWSRLLPQRLQGSLYEGLFHISDWFPTIMDITESSFAPAEGYELDGVSHLAALLSQDETDYPRDHMLYNFYYNVDHYLFNMWINGSFAVRNNQYKLMHTYNSSIYAVWYQPEEMLSDDDAIDEETRCASSTNNDGDFLYWMFDLANDPYETNNIYDSTESEHTSAKEELYVKLTEYAEKAFEITFDFSANRASFEIWKQHGNFMVPYTKASDLDLVNASYPADCYVGESTGTDDDVDNNTVQTNDDRHDHVSHGG